MKMGGKECSTYHSDLSMLDRKESDQNQKTYSHYSKRQHERVYV